MLISGSSEEVSAHDGDSDYWEYLSERDTGLCTEFARKGGKGRQRAQSRKSREPLRHGLEMRARHAVGLFGLLLAAALLHTVRRRE